MPLELLASLIIIAFRAQEIICCCQKFEIAESEFKWSAPQQLRARAVSYQPMSSSKFSRNKFSALNLFVLENSFTSILPPLSTEKWALFAVLLKRSSDQNHVKQFKSHGSAHVEQRCDEREIWQPGSFYSRKTSELFSSRLSSWLEEPGVLVEPSSTGEMLASDWSILTILSPHLS